MKLTPFILTLVIVLLILAPQAQAQTDEKAAVSAVLNALHEAASEADGERYFGLYTDDAIFLGTDATERWTLNDFKAYAKIPFEQGRGWTYHSTARNIYLSNDGNTAWFDETLTNDFLGDTRGSGVLVKTDDGWRIAQYNLTIPIPNELAREVVDMIQDQANQ